MNRYEDWLVAHSKRKNWDGYNERLALCLYEVLHQARQVDNIYLAKALQNLDKVANESETTKLKAATKTS